MIKIHRNSNNFLTYLDIICVVVGVSQAQERHIPNNNNNKIIKIKIIITRKGKCFTRQNM